MEKILFYARCRALESSIITRYSSEDFTIKGVFSVFASMSTKLNPGKMIDDILEAEREAKITWHMSEPMMPWEDIPLLDQDGLIWLAAIRLGLSEDTCQELMPITSLSPSMPDSPQCSPLYDTVVPDAECIL